MDRFEDNLDDGNYFAVINLHSSMDRFEEDISADNCVLFLIYIPVWIDLKRNKIQLNRCRKLSFTFQYG